MFFLESMKRFMVAWNVLWSHIAFSTHALKTTVMSNMQNVKHEFRVTHPWIWTFEQLRPISIRCAFYLATIQCCAKKTFNRMRRNGRKKESESEMSQWIRVIRSDKVIPNCYAPISITTFPPFPNWSEDENGRRKMENEGKNEWEKGATRRKKSTVTAITTEIHVMKIRAF